MQNPIVRKKKETQLINIEITERDIIYMNKNTYIYCYRALRDRMNAYRYIYLEQFELTKMEKVNCRFKWQVQALLHFKRVIM